MITQALRATLDGVETLSIKIKMINLMTGML